jgi:hypothetical protein
MAFHFCWFQLFMRLLRSERHARSASSACWQPKCYFVQAAVTSRSVGTRTAMNVHNVLWIGHIPISKKLVGIMEYFFTFLLLVSVDTMETKLQKLSVTSQTKLVCSNMYCQVIVGSIATLVIAIKYLIFWYICQLLLGWHPVAVHIYT